MVAIAHAQQTLQVLSQALADAQDACAPYYLKIEGKGEEQKVVVVRGKFACFKAFFGCLFRRSSYNTQAVQTLIQKSVDIVKGHLSQDASLHHLLQPLQKAFSSDSKLRNYRPKGQVSWAPVALEALSRSIPASSSAKKPPQIPKKDPTTLFWESAAPLIHEVFGEDNEITSSKDVAQREGKLRSALEKRLADLVNVPDSHTGRLGALWQVKSGKRFFSTYIFQTKGSRENQCYTIVRTKLDVDMQHIKNANKEQMQTILFHILQAEALLQVNTDNRPLTQAALKARLLLEIEAFATHPLVVSHTKTLQEQLKSRDPVKLSRDDIDLMLSSLAEAMPLILANEKDRPMLHGWLTELHTLLVGIQSPQAPLEVAETTEETEEDFPELVAQVRNECTKPCKEIGIDLEKILISHDSKHVDKLLHAVYEKDKKISAKVGNFDESEKIPQTSLKTRLSNGLARSAVRDRYTPSDENRRMRLRALIAFSRRLVCVDYLKRYSKNANDEEARQAVECLQLWDRAREENLPQEHPFWKALYQEESFDIQAPPSAHRLGSLKVDDIRKLTELLSP